MSCDGGKTPKRKEIVKKKVARPRQKRDKSIVEAEKWKNCDICDWILKKPIVAGQYGHIFCKECVIRHLINYIRHETIASYHLVADKAPKLNMLRSMKDVVELKLKENPDKDQSQASTSDEETVEADFVCPITGLETNGKHKFVFSWNCGCVVSEQAIKDLLPFENKCLVCQTPYAEYELVNLLPDRKELKLNEVKAMVRYMAPHLLADKAAREKAAREKANSSQSSTSSSRGRRSNASDNRRQHEVSPGSSPSSKSQSKRHKS